MSSSIIKRIVKSIIRWAVSSDEDKRNYPQDSPMPVTISGGMNASKASIGSSRSIDIHGMNFTIYSATGGKVVEFKTYDPRTDRSVNTLYVITDKENLGEELGQIITKESLCR